MKTRIIADSTSHPSLAEVFGVDGYKAQKLRVVRAIYEGATKHSIFLHSIDSFYLYLEEGSVDRVGNESWRDVKIPEEASRLMRAMLYVISDLVPFDDEEAAQIARQEEEQQKFLAQRADQSNASCPPSCPSS